MTKFGFGIVDKDGNPYWNEDCVAEDRVVLEMEILPDLNAERDGKGPYRVVTLWRR